MFDFLRNFGRSSEDKQQEVLSAYLDNELAPADRDRLEQQLASDRRLQDELAEMQAWQQQMRGLPRRRVPRNFTLDPALYGRPQRQPMTRVYPVLRTATAFTAILLVVALAANVFLGQSATMGAPQEAAMSITEMAAEEAPMAAIVQDEAEMAAEPPALEMEIQEEAAVIVEEAFRDDNGLQQDADSAAEIPAESFLLEESALEMEAAEAPSDFAAETELMPQATPSLSPALEMVEETSMPQAAGGGRDGVSAESLPQIESLPEIEPVPTVELLPPESELAGEAPQPRIAPKSPEPTAVAAEQLTESPSLAPLILSPLIITLAVLFIIFAVLTLLARSRR